MELDTQLEKILNEINELKILTRVNNVLVSRFIVELQGFKKYQRVPNTQHFFRFELLDDEYSALVREYGKDDVDRALYRLDRLLITNKMSCPNNISKYVRRKLEKKAERNTDE